MTARYLVGMSVSRLGRLRWLAGLALPVIFAACGQNGSNSGY
jgi:hypothetical protein